MEPIRGTETGTFAQPPLGSGVRRWRRAEASPVGVTHRRSYPRRSRSRQAPGPGELAERSGVSAGAGRGGARWGGRRKSRSSARAPQRPAEAEPRAAARARKKTRLEGRAESGREVVWLRQPNGRSPRLGPPTLLPPLAGDVSRRGGAERAPSLREGCCG